MKSLRSLDMEYIHGGCRDGWLSVALMPFAGGRGSCKDAKGLKACSICTARSNRG